MPVKVVDIGAMIGPHTRLEEAAYSVARPFFKLKDGSEPPGWDGLTTREQALWVAVATTLALAVVMRTAPADIGIATIAEVVRRVMTGPLNDDEPGETEH